jgi:hypothetical protein
LFPPARIEVESDGFRELELSDAIIIAGRDQRRLLIDEGDFGPGGTLNRGTVPGFKTVLHDP